MFMLFSEPPPISIRFASVPNVILLSSAQISWGWYKERIFARAHQWSYQRISKWRLSPHAVGKSGWFFLLLVQSLIKIHPCGPYKRRGNMHQNTQLERKGLQSLGIDMLIVISCRIFKDILTFVDVTRHIYLLPRRTHRTITFFICSSKFFDSQGIELVNNEIAISTGNLYGNFLSRFISFIRFNFSLQCKHST